MMKESMMSDSDKLLMKRVGLTLVQTEFDKLGVVERERDEARERVAELQAKLVYEFNEDEVPSFRDGVGEPHELETLVTAERCRELVALLRKTLERVAELEKKGENS